MDLVSIGAASGTLVACCAIDGDRSCPGGEAPLVSMSDEAYGWIRLTCVDGLDGESCTRYPDFSLAVLIVLDVELSAGYLILTANVRHMP